MQFDIVTIFPEMFAALNCGITGRAINSNIIAVQYWNPRNYSKDKHKRVDDRPFGGGPGMVMMAEPLHDTIIAAKKTHLTPPKVVHLSPQGKPLTQEKIQQIAQTQQNLILIAGRYEGIDERLLELDVDEEWSIADYVLSGGELAAMVVIDAITRLLPEALGDSQSAQQDSFANGLLDCPHYTRPELFNGQAAPKVLLSGDHKKIADWRLKQALGRTYLRRPDLLKKYSLTAKEKKMLVEFFDELTK